MVMALMKFIVKYFSEIAIKSKPVRRRFIRQLAENLRALLRDIDPAVMVHKGWDKLEVQTSEQDEAVVAAMVEAMCNAPGITYVLEVSEHPLPELDAIVELVLPVYAERLAGKTFALRCKRNGNHEFTSIEVERVVGGAVLPGPELPASS